MKKITILIVMFMLCTFGVASANDVVFELNADNFTSTSNTSIISGIVDATGNSTSTALKGSTIAKSSFINVNGETKNYLNLRNGGLQFNNSAVANSLNEVTFEAWAKLKLTSNDWRCLFSFGEVPRTTDSTERASVRLVWYQSGLGGVNKFFVYKGAEKEKKVGGGYSMVEGYYDGAALDEKWAHYVFTRKWNSTTGQWTITAYANGNLIMNETATGLNLPAPNNLLSIGWNNTDDRYSIGDMGAFKVYNRAFTATEALAKYNETKNEYIALSNTMNLINITPKTTEISLNQATISLEFDNLVDKNSLGNGIIFQKSDGTIVKGGYYVTADGKIISINFGKLEEQTNYTLSLTANLQSINKIAATPKQFNFSTGVDSGLLLDEDFQSADYIVGQNPPANKGVDYYERQNIKVCEENGDKYLKLKGVANAMVYKNLDNPLIDGSISVEVVLRASSEDDSRGSGTMARDSGRIFWDKTNLAKTSDVISIAGGYPQIINSFSGSIPFTYNQDTDENGFYGIRYNMKKNVVTNGFDIEISNLFNSTAGSATISFDASKGTKIDGIMATHIYPWGSDAQLQLEYDSSEISSFKIYGVVEPKILHTTADNMDPANREITVIFNDDMVGSTVNNSNIKILNKATKESIPYHISSEYNADDRSVKMMLDQYLDFFTEYEIVCDNVQNNKDSFVSKTRNLGFVTAPYFITATSVEVTKGTNSVTAKAILKNTDLQSKDVLVVCVLYDEKGRMKKIVTTPSSLTFNQSKSISATISNVEIKSGYKARTYILDRTNGYVKPIKMTVDDIIFN